MRSGRPLEEGTLNSECGEEEEEEEGGNKCCVPGVRVDFPLFYKKCSFHA